MKPPTPVTKVYILSILLLSAACSQKENPEINTSRFAADTDRQWYEKPLRILQTVLREPDGKDYDAESVIEYMKQTHANVLVINAGVIYDFFDNPLPAANVNRFFREGDDVLRDAVKACHANGFKVIARIDFRGVIKEIYDQHPGWFARDVHGDPVIMTYTRIPLYMFCYESYYRNEHALNFLDHLFEEYHIDGIWHNAVQAVANICYCERCRKLYREAVGDEIPIPGESSEAEIDRYYNWKASRASNHMRTIRGKIKEYGEDKAYVAEVFSMYDVSGPRHSGIDLYTARDHFDFLVSVNFLYRNGYKNLGYSASIIRFLRALDPGKQAVILWGQNGGKHRYIMEPCIGSRIFLWEAIASGGGLWNCSFTGQHPGATYDTRNAMIHQDAYRFIEENGNAFNGLHSVEEVSIYFSKSTRMHFGSDDPVDDRWGTAMQGMERMCRENHIQYGFLPDENLSPGRLKNVKVLFLPNVACMSNDEIDVVRKWVDRGGKLMASFKTSLYDRNGNMRPDFALGDLFGCRYAGSTMDTQNDCYQWINDHGIILPGKMQDTRMLINGGETVLCDVTSETARTVCSYMPRIISQSPEMAWLPEKEMKTVHPTVLVNKFGKGKVVYFANQPDRMNHLMGHPDYSDLLHGAVLYLLDDAPMITTNAPPSVHVWVNRSRDEGQMRYVVSLVNVTGGYERPLRSLSPVQDITVKLNIPENQKFRNEILRKESNIGIFQNNNVISMDIDRLNEFVSIALF